MLFSSAASFSFVPVLYYYSLQAGIRTVIFNYLLTRITEKGFSLSLVPLSIFQTSFRFY
jgi:hypothetical protein